MVFSIFKNFRNYLKDITAKYYIFSNLKHTIYHTYN